MRQETINIFKFSELSDEAKERARDKYRSKNYEIHWQEEILDSLKTLFEKCSGVSLVDYELGLCCYSYLKVSFSQDEAGDLAGGRAMAWLENNLLSGLRMPFIGKRRNETRKYGSGYRPGQIEPCPLTGICFDDDYLEDLISNVKAGYTLKESFERLASKYQEILEAENEHQNSDEYIDDHFEANEYEFEENGSEYR